MDHNATQAAIRAGYSPKTAQEQSSRLLSFAMVREYIEKAEERLQEKTGITIERVRQELAKVGFARMDDYTTWGPDGVRMKASDEEGVDGAVVRKVSERRTITTSKDGFTTETGHIDFELHDKLKALELLGKEMGMFKDRDKDDPPGVNVNVNIMSPEDRAWREKWIGIAEGSDGKKPE